MANPCSKLHVFIQNYTTTEANICFILARKCPTGILSKVTECQDVGNQLYVLGCDADNWFTAKHVCDSIGAMLLPTKPSNGFKLDCRNRFWIGLSKEKWFHVSPRGKGSLLIDLILLK